MNMHQIILLGRATKDAEEYETKKGKKFVKFTVAVNEYKGPEVEEETYFYDVLIFNKTSETALKNIKKGDTTMVMGKPEVDAYISKKDNEPKGTITVVAESWKVLK
jgi:single-strand DNA-binding protein